MADDKTFVYLAKDEAIIRKHAEISGFPATKITEVEENDRPDDDGVTEARTLFIFSSENSAIRCLALIGARRLARRSSHHARASAFGWRFRGHLRSLGVNRLRVDRARATKTDQ